MKFELKSLPRNASDEEIVAEIKRVDLIVGKDLLTKKDYDEHGKITSGAIQKRLGGWQKALITAGLGYKYSGRTISEKMRQQSKNLTDEEILEELRAVAKKLGKNYVSQEEANDNSEIISASTIIYRFGTWPKGLEKAGLQLSPMGKRFTEDEYYENLLNVWTRHGRQPFLREMAEYPSVITPSGYEARFGSWRKALEAFVEKMNQENGESGPKDVVSVAEKPKEAAPPGRRHGPPPRQGLGDRGHARVPVLPAGTAARMGSRPEVAPAGRPPDGQRRRLPLRLHQPAADRQCDRGRRPAPADP